MKPICLPGPKLKDTKITGQLAGYGNYFRGACLTNSNGPMKYHYCMGETICDFKNNCEPHSQMGYRTTRTVPKIPRQPDGADFAQDSFGKVATSFNQMLTRST